MRLLPAKVRSAGEQRIETHLLRIFRIDSVDYRYEHDQGKKGDETGGSDCDAARGF